MSIVKNRSAVFVEESGFHSSMLMMSTGGKENASVANDRWIDKKYKNKLHSLWLRYFGLHR